MSPRLSSSHSTSARALLRSSAELYVVKRRHDGPPLSGNSSGKGARRSEMCTYIYTTLYTAERTNVFSTSGAFKGIVKTSERARGNRRNCSWLECPRIHFQSSVLRDFRRVKALTVREWVKMRVHLGIHRMRLMANGISSPIIMTNAVSL